MTHGIDPNVSMAYRGLRVPELPERTRCNDRGQCWVSMAYRGLRVPEHLLKIKGKSLRNPFRWPIAA